MRVPRGLKGVVVADTSDRRRPRRGGLLPLPRSTRAVELAEHRPIEDVWRLMIDGALPATLAERRRVRRRGRRRCGPSPTRWPPCSRRSPPSASRSTGCAPPLSLRGRDGGMRPTIDLTPAQRRADALRLCAVTPTLLCALHRLRARPRSGRAAPGPRATPPTTCGWSPGASRRRGTPGRSSSTSISTIDHGFNASTFTARVVASTGADLGACVVAAIGALSGPLHGGAPSRALALIDEIGIRRPDRRGGRARRSSPGERIMGFGHAVYRTADPRAVMLRRVAAGAGRRRGERRVRRPRRSGRGAGARRCSTSCKPGRRLHTNVELYAGVVMELCGIPREMFTPTFAASRVIGWCANVLEQAADDQIIRPSARYVGPAGASVGGRPHPGGAVGGAGSDRVVGLRAGRGRVGRPRLAVPPALLVAAGRIGVPAGGRGARCGRAPAAAGGCPTRASPALLGWPIDGGSPYAGRLYGCGCADGAVRRGEACPAGSGMP